MKFRMDKCLQFWTDVSYEDMKLEYPDFTKRQLLTQILRQYEACGDAMRYLDTNGTVAWKATPWLLTRLADAERDAQDDLEDWL